MTHETRTRLPAAGFQAAIAAARVAARRNSLRDLWALTAGAARFQAHRIERAYRRERQRAQRGLLAA